MRVTALWVYPVKSLGGIALDAARLDATGLAYDRRWMLVDAAGRFLTQRAHPQLATVRVALTDAGLTLTHPDVSDGLAVPAETPPDAPLRRVTVWDDTVDARVVEGAAGPWLKAATGLDATLVWMPPTTVRPVDATYGQPGDRVGFADGFPLLVTTEASLAALNARLEAPVAMARFRPNLVLDGDAAWAEDGWQTLTVGAVRFRVAKPCGRCSMVDVDPARGAAGNAGVLSALAVFRTQGRRVVFGQNLAMDAGFVGATLRVGDTATAG